MSQNPVMFNQGVMFVILIFSWNCVYYSQTGTVQKLNVSSHVWPFVLKEKRCYKRWNLINFSSSCTVLSFNSTGNVSAVGNKSVGVISVLWSGINMKSVWQLWPHCCDMKSVHTWQHFGTSVFSCLGWPDFYFLYKFPFPMPGSFNLQFCYQFQQPPACWTPNLSFHTVFSVVLIHLRAWCLSTLN